MELTSAEALGLRMRSLLLDPRGGEGSAGADSVSGVVEWFGAMQSQDLGSGLWSLGVRLPGLSLAEIEEALERRQALRTWPMRGTVHFVPPRDAHWMLELMGSRASAGAARRREALGLSQDLADRAVDVIGAALAGGRRLTRAQCLDALARAGVEVAGQRGYHLLWYASQRGVTCIAPNLGKEQTFVLLDEWVPDPVQLGRDEALATIALRYFRSHGPTTRQDFAGWTGLTVADAKAGIVGARDALTTVQVEGREMLLAPEVLATLGESVVGSEAPEVLVLPGFDEYLLGYKDRSLMLAEEHKQAIIPGGNGVFQPTIVREARVVATWRRTSGKARTVVAVLPLVKLRVRDRPPVEAAFAAYGDFLARPVEVRWP